MSPSAPTVYCLEILADADPVVLIRLVERIQSLGLIAKQLTAKWIGDERVRIEFIFAGIAEHDAQTFASRVGQFATVHSVIASAST